MSLVLLALCCLASAASSATPARPRSLDAAEQLAALLARVAPPERGRAIRNVRMRGTARIAGYDGVGRWEELHGAPGEARISVAFDAYGEHEEGLVDQTAWEAQPATGAWVKDRADTQAAARRYAWTSMRGLERHCEAVRDLGERPVDGRTVLVFAIGEREGDPDPKAAAASRAPWAKDLPREDLVLIDTADGLPFGLVFQERTAEGTPVERSVRLSDWREVDGVRYPHRRDVRVHETTIEVELTSIEHDVELPADAFAVPDPVALAMREEAKERSPDAIRVQELPEQHVATIRIECAPADIGKELGVALPELMVHINSVGARSRGAPYTRYFEFGPDKVDMEAGIPVAEPLEAAGRIRPGKLPGGKAAVAWHVGPYHTLGETHAKLDAWIAARGLTAAGPQWEVYWTDPGMEPDPSKWRTQVFRPVRDAD